MALSTLRRLDFMIITISTGLSSSTFFQRLTRVISTLIVYLCWGVIHSVEDSQDICFMGDLPIYIILLLRM